MPSLPQPSPICVGDGGGVAGADADVDLAAAAIAPSSMKTRCGATEGSGWWAAEVVTTALGDGGAAVRIAAACSLAGLCDALRRRAAMQPASAPADKHLLSLLAGACRLMQFPALCQFAVVPRSHCTHAGQLDLSSIRPD